MSNEQEPWTVVTWDQAGEGMDYRPGLAFFCPECAWRVGTFAGNVEGDVHELEDNKPGTVLGFLRG